MKDLNITKLSDSHSIAYARINYAQEQEMIKNLQNHKLDLSKLENISSDRRRIEWISIRQAALTLLGQSDDIIYDEHDKPHFLNCSHHLSISHSKDMIAISIDKRFNTGIDIQWISPKIVRLKHKFLNSKEQGRSSDDPVELSYYWSIKEALFKVYGKKDAFLKDNFEVDILSKKTDEGIAVGKICTHDLTKELNVRFKQIEDYVLAYVVNS